MNRELTWQHHGDDNWVFGKMVRGVVRAPYLAELYFDEASNPGWIWFVKDASLDLNGRGQTNTFGDAIEAAESVLRILGEIE